MTENIKMNKKYRVFDKGAKKFRVYFSAPKGKNKEYENIGDNDWNNSLNQDFQKTITLIKEGKIEGVLNSIILGVTLPANPFL